MKAFGFQPHPNDFQNIVIIVYHQNPAHFSTFPIAFSL
ncbi:conserved hypothetical protein [delta proteobacterium NaphS2]|nr:conserved hypothetical protein [delta proteobacterium NaphS2]